MQHIEENATKRDREENPYSEVGTYEVTCVHCGQVEILESTGQSDTREREYVGEGVYCIRGESPPVYYEDKPVVCSKCGAEWNLDNLSIKKISVELDTIDHSSVRRVISYTSGISA